MNQENTILMISDQRCQSVSKNLFKLSSSLITRNSLGGVESDEEEFETQSIADSIDSDQSSTIQVISRNNSAQKTQQERVQRVLSTFEDTPAPTTPISEQISAPSQAQPRQEIVGDLNESNIIEGTRTRKPSKRHQAYLTDLARPDKLTAYHSAFALGTKAGHPRIHQNNLLPPPRSWKEL
jgi:hypothetical protein